LGGLLPANTKTVNAGTPVSSAPQMVADLREGSNSSAPEEMLTIGSTLFFTANDGENGRELFRTSPPYTSAQLVKDICLGGCSAEPASLTASGTTLFFSARDVDHGIELWRSEPPYNASSTFLVADINANGDSSPNEFTAIGTALFFRANDGASGYELWRSDAPFTSASQVKDIYPGPAHSWPSELTRIGWMLFFTAEDDSGVELWRSDPPYSSLSTQRVVDLNPDGSAEVSWLTPIDLKLFFSATNGESGQDLWVIESPYHEARRVNDILGDPLSTNPNRLYALGDSLFFNAWVYGGGYELYRTEPPYDPQHTYLVEDLTDSLFGSLPENKTAIGSTLFFVAEGADGDELHKTTPPYVPDTTDIVADINPGAAGSSPQYLTPVGTTLFFTAYQPRSGWELWKSEPPYTQSTTSLVYDLIEGDAGSDPYGITAVDRTLFFGATSAHQGIELFRFGGAYAMPDTGFAPGKFTRLAAQPAEKTYRAMSDLRLVIPALALDASIVGVPVSADGWALDWLGRDLGYLHGTAFPGWAGNSVLTGHVYLPDGSPGPFAGLKNLRYDEKVVLHSYGQRYTYAVRSVTQIDLNDVESVFAHEDLSWLTLVTCQDFDEQTNEYRARLLVRAVLISVEDE
jgi:LPXTG-site transpeptidase (sortase) family protein